MTTSQKLRGEFGHRVGAPFSLKWGSGVPPHKPPRGHSLLNGHALMARSAAHTHSSGPGLAVQAARGLFGNMH